MCDVPLCNNPTSLEAFKEHSETIIDSNDDSTSSDDDSPYGENIDYVDASPPDDEIVSLEVVEIVNPEVGRIDDDILLTIKDDILREKLSNVNLLIAKIDALRDNPTPSSTFMIKFYSHFIIFGRFWKEIGSGSPITHSELSLPDFKAFYIDNIISKFFYLSLSITIFLSIGGDRNHEEFADESCLTSYSPPNVVVMRFASAIPVLVFYLSRERGLGKVIYTKERKQCKHDQNRHGMEKACVRTLAKAKAKDQISQVKVTQQFNSQNRSCIEEYYWGLLPISTI
ncbi:hypothetical protein Tco_1315061 [Tanacetum coccineum]